MRRLAFSTLWLVLAVTGAVLAAVEIDYLVEFRKVKAWPTVSGTVVESIVIGERAIRPQIVYEYVVDSTVYRAQSDLGAPMFGGKRKKYDVARELVAQYPEGTQVAVSYNPDSAAQSSIVSPVTWDIFAKLGLGVVLMVIGIVGWVIRPRAGRSLVSRAVDSLEPAENDGNR